VLTAASPAATFPIWYDASDCVKFRRAPSRLCAKSLPGNMLRARSSNDWAAFGRSSRHSVSAADTVIETAR
jgi:hypothetical protein